MARIGIELPGDLVELIDRQAGKDGHDNRCAVVRKALNAFFAGSPGGGAEVATEPTTTKESVTCGIELSDEIVTMIDEQAQRDGHSNRSAVIRKALVYFFAK